MARRDETALGLTQRVRPKKDTWVNSDGVICDQSGNPIPAASSEITPWDTTISELRRAAEACARENKRFKIPRAGIQLSEPWEIDVSKVDCLWEGAVFEPQHLDVCLHLVGQQNPTYFNSMRGVRDFALVGPGETEATSIGVLLQDEEFSPGSVNGPNRIGIKNYCITQFGEGIRHGSRSYGELIGKGAIWDCGYGVRFLDLQADAGEAPTYFKTFIFQCLYWGMSIEGTHGTWVHANEVHLDHNQRQVQVIGKAKLKFLNGHIEAQDHTAGPPVYVSGDGSTFFMRDGELVFTKDTTRTMQYVVDCNASQGFGGAFFEGVDFYKVWTASGYFSTGAGQVYIGGYTTISDRRNVILLNSNFNQLVDGGFEDTTVPDVVQIYGDTAAITARLTGTNLNIATNTTTPRSGARVLRATKAGGTGTTARFYIAVPLKDFRQRGTFRLYMRKTAAGTVTVNPVYAAIRPGSNAGTWIHSRTTGSESAISFTDTGGGWVEVKSRDTNIKPALPFPWATHYGLFIDMNAMAAGDLDLDDLEIALM